MVVMGVAGSGKSTISRELAASTGVPLIEGDDFHPAENRRKMQQGVPLTDDDRGCWLDELARQLLARPEGAVLSCSALKRDYRNRLRDALPGLRFVYLDIDQSLAHQRVAARNGEHLFPPSLVASQFSTLEAPRDEPGVLWLDASTDPQVLVAQTIHWLREAVPQANEQDNP